MQILPFFDADHLELRERVRGWVDANLIGVPAGERNLEDEARRLVKQLGAAGFTQHSVPRAYGGARDKVEARDLCILREELARGSALADTMFAMQGLGSYSITLAGSDGSPSGA